MLEDLDSRKGTWLGKDRITTQFDIKPEDIFTVGSSRMSFLDLLESEHGHKQSLSEFSTLNSFPDPESSKVEQPQPGKASMLSADAAKGRSCRIESPDGSAALIQSGIDARRRCSAYLDGNRQGQAERIDHLLRLTAAVAAAKDVKLLSEQILNELTKLIPGAEIGAILIYESETGKLALRASLPEDDPPLSRTLIKKAAADYYGFIWNRGEADHVPNSVRLQSIASGIYLPLVWNEQLLGVISLVNQEQERAFEDDDLRILLGFGQCMAAGLSRELS